MSNIIQPALAEYIEALSDSPQVRDKEPTTWEWYSTAPVLWSDVEGRRHLRCRVQHLAEALSVRLGVRLTTRTLCAWIEAHPEQLRDLGWDARLFRAYPTTTTKVPSLALDELQGTTMNQTRQQALLNGVTSVARKLYESLPEDNSPRQYKEVCADLQRRGISPPGYDVLRAAMSQLITTGLARETTQGLFSRTPVRAKSDISHASGDVPQQEPAPQEPAPQVVVVGRPAPASDEDPLTVLAELAARLRQTQAQLGTLADEIDHTALAVADKIDSIRKETEKFEQLRRLLADIK